MNKALKDIIHEIFRAFKLDLTLAEKGSYYILSQKNPSYVNFFSQPGKLHK